MSLKPGKHTINFDASGFSSGVYFYLLESGTKRIARKFELLK
jgi:hypothetical protein